jgi:hypothetical protein
MKEKISLDKKTNVKHQVSTIQYMKGAGESRCSKTASRTNFTINNSTMLIDIRSGTEDSNWA